MRKGDEVVRDRGSELNEREFGDKTLQPGRAVLHFVKLNKSGLLFSFRNPGLSITLFLTNQVICVCSVLLGAVFPSDD